MDKNDRSDVLRLLPSVDAVLQTKTAVKLLPEVGGKHLTDLARRATDLLRSELLKEKNGNQTYSRETLLQEAEKRLQLFRKNESKSNLRKVINATGVIIHTNLGRAPLSENARKAVIENAFGYCNLELDVETGKRGKRGERVENLLAELTGAEDALVVNNCAAAAFLILTVFAKGGEVIISRGELVEIGGDFRVPDVMEQSGATLREVGATNRTRIEDYERAISENTKMLLKVHPSNYRIVGFTEMPDISELAMLAHQNNILVYEDAGSGAMFDLSEYGLTDEPIISASIRAGADVVSFSGDKLLGGAQSGIIVGCREAIEKIRRHPLYRALRVNKLIYAALEATLEAFQRETALQEIPVLRMLSTSNEELKKRTSKFVKKLNKNLGENENLKLEIIEGKSVVGGGSAPMVQPATTLLAVRHRKLSAARLEEKLRFSNPPIISRILEDRNVIDLRCISDSEETELLEILTNLFST